MGVTSLKKYLADANEVLHDGHSEVSDFFSLKTTISRLKNIWEDVSPQDIHSLAKKAIHVSDAKYKDFFNAWINLICKHLHVCSLLSRNDVEEAHAKQMDLMRVVQKEFKALTSDYDSIWLLDMLCVLCYDARCLAYLVDDNKYRNGGYTIRCWDAMETSAQEINGVIRICGMDRQLGSDVTKKSGLTRIANELFKIYYRVGSKNQLSKRLFTTIQQLPSDVWNDTAGADIVTYRYYHGKNALVVEEREDDALPSLETAYNMCPPICMKNRRAIAVYLTICKMLKWYMPSDQFLQENNLWEEFGQLKTAIITGNIALFEDVMELHEDFMASWGVDFLVRKLLVHTQRNLMKKVWLILQTHQIPFSMMVRALQVAGLDDCDTMEAECLMANMIYEGRIKGYITHAHQMLVVSKTDPFPRQTPP